MGFIRWSSSTIVAVLVVLLQQSLVFVRSQATKDHHDVITRSTCSTGTININQSYKHNLSSQEIAQSIRRQIRHSLLLDEHEQQKEKNDDDTEGKMMIKECKIQMDVSCSFLQDEGIENIIDSLQQEMASSTTTTRPSSLSISFEARMNRITSKGVASLFNTLISFGEKEEELNKQKENIEDNDAETQQQENGDHSHVHEKNTTNVDDEKKGGEQNEESLTSSLSQQLLQNNIYMESIDIGLNDLGSHDGVLLEETSNNKEQQIFMTNFLHSVQKIIGNQSGLVCPTTLRMDHCGLGPLACRYIGKGIVDSMQHLIEDRNNKNKANLDNSISMDDNTSATTIKSFYPHRRLRELYLSANPIGDSGTTALAAALKISPTIKDDSSATTTSLKSTNIVLNDDQSPPDDDSSVGGEIGGCDAVIDTLDISSCHVGDVGAQALSLAIMHNPRCVKRLLLSNNKITNRGAIALAKALCVSQQRLMTSSTARNDKYEKNKKKFGLCCYAIDTLDLSNNADIDDEGAIALFDAVRCGAIRNLLLRSCSIHSEGVSALGRVLAQILIESNDIHYSTMVNKEYNIDISGNKIGSKKLKKKAGYSEKMMKNVNTIGQKGFGFLKSGLKDIVDFGTSSLSVSSSSLESDDEAEEEDDDLLEASQSQVSDKCGAIAFYDSFLECMENIESEGSNNYHEDDSSDFSSTSASDNGDEVEENDNKEKTKIQISMGMRMCNFDDAALDALAAMKNYVKEYSRRIKGGRGGCLLISFDCEMNKDIDDECIQALMKIGRDDHDEQILEEMTERHQEALEIRRRAFEAKSTEVQLNGLFSDHSRTSDNYDTDYDTDYDTEDFF